MEWAGQTILEAAVIHTIFDEEYQMWYCTGMVDKETMEAYLETCFGAIGIKTVAQERLSEFVEYGAIDDLGDSYQIKMLKPSGVPIRVGFTPAGYTAYRASQPIWNLTAEDGKEVAFEAVMSHFMLSYKELDRYFMFSVGLFPDKDNNGQLVVLFCEHNNDMMRNEDWIYGAIVNLGTGELLDCFTQDMLRERPLGIANPKNYTAVNYAIGQYMSWYPEEEINWLPE